VGVIGAGALAGGVGVAAGGAGAMVGGGILVTVDGAVIGGGGAMLEAVLVPAGPGRCPTPNMTASTTTMNAAAAIQPHVAFMARGFGS
jgi:hypothetical protein